MAAAAVVASRRSRSRSTRTRRTPPVQVSEDETFSGMLGLIILWMSGGLEPLKGAPDL